MNNKVLISLLVVGSLVGGIVGAHFFAPILGGDFAGGNLPSQLMTGVDAPVGSAPGYVSPVGGLALFAQGGIGAGGTAAANNITETYTAVATYPWTPSSTSAITIASSTFTAAQTSTQISFTAPGFVIGDPCEVQYSGTTSTLVTQAYVTAVSGNSVTTTVSLYNYTGATVQMTVTSTVTGVTSTVKATCIATGV
jgi:hypothetical protein